MSYTYILPPALEPKCLPIDKILQDATKIETATNNKDTIIVALRSLESTFYNRCWKSGQFKHIYVVRFCTLANLLWDLVMTSC